VDSDEILRIIIEFEDRANSLGLSEPATSLLATGNKSGFDARAVDNVDSEIVPIEFVVISDKGKEKYNGLASSNDRHDIHDVVRIKLCGHNRVGNTV
jgi:hypothetical protein